MKFVVSESQLKKVLSFVERDVKLSINEGHNEDGALKILVKNNMKDPEGVLKILSSIDKSKNHKFLPIIVSFYVFNYHSDPTIITTLTNVFTKIFDEPNYEKFNLTLKNSNTVSINNTDYSVKDFDEFSQYVDHYLYKDSEVENEKNLISTDGNIVFENKKYIIYYAASKYICIDLFGEENTNRRYLKRTYCIGKQNTTNYETYRDPSGEYKRTFYVVVNKDDIKRNLDGVLTITVVSAKRNENDELSYEVWDKNNSGSGDSVEGFKSVNEYIESLKNGGVNINIFKPKKYIDISDYQIDGLLKSPYNFTKFKVLSPKQKYKYVSIKANTLSKEQIEFSLKYMPEKMLINFVTNIPILGDIPTDAFQILPTQLKKSFINTKLIQLSNYSQLFNFKSFKEYIYDDSQLIKYTEKKSNEIYNNAERDQSDNDQFHKLLSIISPSIFFNSLKNKKEVSITPINSLINELPINFGDYVESAEKIIIREMSFTHIPSSIGKCKNLSELIITNCPYLTTVPNEITDIKTLNEIIITKCKLDSLPENIGNLKNLTILNCNQNKLISLPVSLGDCSSLQMLHMEDNLIANISPRTFFRSDVPIKNKDNKINPKLIKLDDLYLVNFDMNPLTDESIDIVELLKKIGDIDINV